MRLKISNIRDRGDLNKERVVFEVESAGDIGEFLLIQTGLRNGETITNQVFDTYWFPDKEVNIGDFVVLYSKIGKNSEKPFNDVTSHFFYWGKTEPIWNIKERAAVLMQAPTWQSHKLERTKE